MKLSDLRSNINSKEKVSCNIVISEILTASGKPYLNIKMSDEETVSVNIWSNDPNYTTFKDIGLNKQFQPNP